MPRTETLQPEVVAFERLYDKLLPAFKGKWAVMHGDGLAFIADDFDGAAEFGYRTYGPGEFLAVRISPEPGQFGLNDEDEDDE